MRCEIDGEMKMYLVYQSKAMIIKDKERVREREKRGRGRKRWKVNRIY